LQCRQWRSAREPRDAAIKGKHDPVFERKENVIIGKLIPAGRLRTDISRNTENPIHLYSNTDNPFWLLIAVGAMD
jgi:hypothetical protein